MSHETPAPIDGSSDQRLKSYCATGYLKFLSIDGTSGQRLELYCTAVRETYDCRLLHT